MRPSRSAAEASRRRTNAVAEAERRPDTESSSDRTSSEREGAAKVKVEGENQPEETNEPETVAPATYNIRVYYFNKARKGFDHPHDLTFSAKQVKTVFGFRGAVVEMRRAGNRMVKVVIAETTNGTTTYEVADSEDFSDYFENARSNAQANTGKQLIGVIHEGGETSDFEKVVEERGFPLV